MEVLKDTFKTCLLIPRLLRQYGGRFASGQQKGLAAILSAPDSHPDYVLDLKFHNYFKPTSKPTPSSPPGKSAQKNSAPLSGPKRTLTHKTSPENSKPLPRLLYIQNPLVWVSNKLDFRFLRVKWDPSFTEAEFTRGARQAISTVTQLLSKNNFDNLKPLFTKNALLNLRRDVEVVWADEVRRNIGLSPQDVQLIIPRKLHFRQGEEPKLLDKGSSLTSPALIVPIKPKPDKKFCDIDVLFIALKYLEGHRFKETPLCFVDIVARFHRNYSEVLPSDWTISAFKVRKFNLIPQQQHIR